MKEKHIPMRMCIGCGVSRPKAELIKINKDDRGKGVYLCKDSDDCLARAIKKKRLPKDFKL